MRAIHLFVIHALSIVAFASHAVAADDKEAAEAIVRGYVSNLEKLSSFQCEFDVVVGAASVREDSDGFEVPLAGHVDTTSRSSGIWYVHNGLSRLELAMSNNALAGSKSEGQLPTGRKFAFYAVIPGKVLWQASGFSAVYSPASAVTCISNARKPRSGGLLTPLDTVSGIVDEIRTVIENGQFYKIDVGSDRNKIWTIHFKNGTFSVSCMIDIEHGFLPRRVEMRNEKGTTSILLVIPEISECSNGGFFPMRSVWLRRGGYGIAHKPNEHEGWAARDIQVTKLECDRPPSDVLFEIEVPAGTLVNDGIRPLQYKLSEVAAIKPDNIKEYFDRLDQRAHRYDTANAVPAPSQYNYGVIALIVVGNTVCIASIIVAIRRTVKFNRRQ